MSRRVDRFELLAGEKLNVSINFSSDLDAGDQVASAEIIQALWTDTHTDASSAASVLSNDTSSATVQLVHLTSGRAALVTVLATLDSGQKFGSILEVSMR